MTDEHDIRKDADTDARISAAQDNAQVAMFGKVAYEAACAHMYESEHEWAGPEWKDLSGVKRVAWCKAAKAVLKEASRVNYFECESLAEISKLRSEIIALRQLADGQAKLGSVLNYLLKHGLHTAEFDIRVSCAYADQDEALRKLVKVVEGRL